jgi:hypothetical protein
MVLMGYSGARGTLIYEKNLKAKISCQTPVKYFPVLSPFVFKVCKKCKYDPIFFVKNAIWVS